MPDSESKPTFLDNPEATTGAITAAALAAFVLIHELVPAHHQNTVKILGSLDLVFNLASWRAIHFAHKPTALETGSTDDSNMQLRLLHLKLPDAHFCFKTQICP